MDISKETFTSGLRLVTVPIEGVASTAVVVAVGVGSRYEDKNQNGISHVLEHMAFKGTIKRPSTLAIAHEIEGVGGNWNAFTSNEITAYWIKTSTEHVETSLDILSDILTNSTLPEGELKKELDVIKEEMKMYQDDPGSYVQELVEEEIFGDQPIGWPVIGKVSSVSSVTRNDLQQLIGSYYRTGNMVIGVAGKIPDDLAAKIAEFFGGIPRGRRSGFVAAKPGPPGKQVRLVTKATEQAHLAFGLEALARTDPDYYSLKVLTTILGKGLGSRLFTTVREEQGLAYSVYASEHGYHDTGYLIIYAGVSIAKTDAAITAVLDQLTLVVKEKVSQVELQRAQEYIKGYLKLNTENTSWVAEQVARQELLDQRILTVEEVSNKIDRVTTEDIFRVAARVFANDRLKLSVIGPFTDSGRFQKLLKF